jgi:hypothetical protein
VAGLFWARGTETSFETRVKLARQRLTGPAAVALAMFTLLWIGAGAYIYYNVSVLNRYVTAKKGRDDQAEYEKRYQKLERALQPKVTDVKLYADVYPEDRRAMVKAICSITNKWNKPIDTLYVSSSQKLRYLKINGTALTPFFKDAILVGPGTPAGAGEEKQSYEKGFLWYRLPKTLQPGDTVTMESLIEMSSAGFPNSGTEREVVYNGTFFSGGVPGLATTGVQN